jgi:hypothetical protein
LDNGKPSVCTIGIVKLNGQYFVDQMALSGEALKNATTVGQPNIHIVCRLNLKGKDRFRADVLNEDWVKEQLTKGKIKVAHTDFPVTPTPNQPGQFSYGAENVCLTASTQDLKKFYASIAKEEKAWNKGDSDVIRKK